jgi:hypothetical protein
MRVVMGLYDARDADSVRDALRALGARTVLGPTPELPEVLIADFPDVEEGDLVEQLAAMPGVRYAEPDELQSAS